jgi:hypothetical protein
LFDEIGFELIEFDESDFVISSFTKSIKTRDNQRAKKKAKAEVIV